jgi:hypothetical protein
MAERRLRSRLHEESAMIDPGDQSNALERCWHPADVLARAGSPQSGREV